MIQMAADRPTFSKRDGIQGFGLGITTDLGQVEEVKEQVLVPAPEQPVKVAVEKPTTRSKTTNMTKVRKDYFVQ